MTSLRSRIEADRGFLDAFRHDLHRHPELMYQEHRTASRVADELTQIGVPHRAGLAGGTGVVGWLPATVVTEHTRTIALRADMDALPIEEETGLPYASQTPGKMHACGHDGHTTVLMGTARALLQVADRPHNIVFLFQPAEEGGAGANRLVEDGALDGRVTGFKVDACFGLHGWPEEELGLWRIKEGPMMAATDELRIHIRGRGGHAAAPHFTDDPVVATAHVITGLQSIASRRVDPLDAVVVTIGAIHGGMANNVIPECVEMRGTLRTLQAETRTFCREKIHQMVKGIAAAHNCTGDLEILEGYPVTYNESRATAHYRQLIAEVHGESAVQTLEAPVMGGEDFSYYGAHAPAAFAFLGLRREGDENPAPVHTPRFDWNDAATPLGVEVFCRLALTPLSW